MIVGVFREPYMDVIVFDNQYNLMYSMGRLQEFYENPKLNGIYFTRERLQAFQHDYYIKWNGCNVPPDCVSRFRDVYHDKLDVYEAAVLNEITDGKYVVGVHLGLGEKMVDTIDHERAHAMYAMDAEYRKKADRRIASIDGYHYHIIKNKLLSMGYVESVIHDEIQAYMASGWEKLGLDFDIRDT